MPKAEHTLKVLVFLLVLANLLLYALSNGLFGHPDNPDAGRIEQQIAPDRIKIVSRGEAPAGKAPEPVTDKANDSCLRWDALAMREADQLEILIKEKFPDLAVTRQTQAGEGSSWWVHIPPLASKQEAEKRAGELRQLGISDYFILLDNGNNRFAISLGVFSSEKGGTERLAELKAKGIKTARVIMRPGKETQYQIEARGPLADKAGLTEVVSGIVPKTPAAHCK